MDVSRLENLPPPPGVINSLRAGFDAVASHVTAILFPLTLNLFLWLGPRLRMSALYDSIKDEVVATWQRGGVPAQDIQAMLDTYNATIPTINLFWLLRTIPIGVASLPFVKDGSTPLGTPVVWQANEFSLFGWLFLLTLIGWAGGGVYFRTVAKLAIQDKALPGVGRAMAQTFMLSFAWAVVFTAVFMPFMVVLAVFAQINQGLAGLLILFASFVSVWLVVPLYFWSHGIFMRGENLLTAMASSWRLTRFMLPSSSMFVLTVFLLAFGLNFLWSVPAPDSWLTLVGIFGHSFVATALLASSFIYYRDTIAWLEAALEKFRAHQAGA